MCGRFTLSADPGELAEYFQAPPVPWTPCYNIAPTQTVLACRIDPRAGARELVPLRWGLVPTWAADLSAGVKAINARAETVAEKPTFRPSASPAIRSFRNPDQTAPGGPARHLPTPRSRDKPLEGKKSKGAKG